MSAGGIKHGLTVLKPLLPKLVAVRLAPLPTIALFAALSVTERHAARAVLDEVDYVELSGRSDFNDLFVDQLAFPA